MRPLHVSHMIPEAPALRMLCFEVCISFLAPQEQSATNQWLKTTEVYSFPGLEAGLQSRCRQGHAPCAASRRGSVLASPSSWWSQPSLALAAQILSALLSSHGCLRVDCLLTWPSLSNEPRGPPTPVLHHLNMLSSPKTLFPDKLTF